MDQRPSHIVGEARAVGITSGLANLRLRQGQVLGDGLSKISRTDRRTKTFEDEGEEFVDPRNTHTQKAYRAVVGGSPKETRGADVQQGPRQRETRGTSRGDDRAAPYRNAWDGVTSTTSRHQVLLPYLYNITKTAQGESEQEADAKGCRRITRSGALRRSARARGGMAARVGDHRPRRAQWVAIASSRDRRVATGADVGEAIRNPKGEGEDEPLVIRVVESDTALVL